MTSLPGAPPLPAGPPPESDWEDSDSDTATETPEGGKGAGGGPEGAASHLGKRMYYVIHPTEARDTPSRRHGVNRATEASVRRWGCQVLQEAGVHLHLPQVAIARAEVILHRFYTHRSLCTIEMRDVLPAILFLAAKLDENFRKIRQ